MDRQIRDQLTKKISNIDRGVLGQNETANYRNINEKSKYENINWVLEEYEKNRSRSLSKSRSRSPSQNQPTLKNSLDQKKHSMEPQRKRHGRPLTKGEYEDRYGVDSMYLPLSREPSLALAKKGVSPRKRTDSSQIPLPALRNSSEIGIRHHSQGKFDAVREATEDGSLDGGGWDLDYVNSRTRKDVE